MDSPIEESSAWDMDTINGTADEIGFGAITEIKRYAGHGLKFVAPLPAEYRITRDMMRD